VSGRAFVLAGGLGLRLRPKFGELPKPLAPLGGRPFLALLLEWLAARDVRDAVICAGHGADALRAALGDGAAQGVRLHWSVEPEPLGTGGALRHAAAFVDGPAWVLNGDTLPECDPWELERDRWNAGALGAVALFRAADAGARGRVDVDDRGRVTAFVEKDAGFRGEAWVNGGLYAFGPALWRRLPPGASSLERDVLPGVAAAGMLLGRRCAGRFFDIGTPEDFARAEREIAR
jgi:NDP-sugar pyrophosphorylase family protein